MVGTIAALQCAVAGPMTRRALLAGSLATLSLAVTGVRSAMAAGFQPAAPVDGGRLLGLVPMSDPRSAPLGRLLRSGLDARRFTDLSALTPDTLVIPSDRFFIRTACPEAVRGRRDWSIAVDGLVRAPSAWSLASLVPAVRPTGTYLFECSGNGDPNNFGLISAAAWSGIPIDAILERAGRLPQATRLKVSGVDHAGSETRTSVPGAAWIFAIDELQQAGAFLATQMNGAPLAADHGGPVRLVVPGRYGCTCIKWVERLEFVDDTAVATSQMREFAERTHQRGEPELARDYAPATIDHAAVPIRVEKRLLNGRLFYRVVGIQWGGTEPIDAFTIRFGRELPYVPVAHCPTPFSPATWSLWHHDWRPATPGRYEIDLRTADETLPTRRLDMLFYRRSLVIDAV
jgi:DMSO/TMAO reductase YedYZ molybdopterin-dependent catalytic subunit